MSMRVLINTERQTSVCVCVHGFLCVFGSVETAIEFSHSDSLAKGMYQYCVTFIPV